MKFNSNKVSINYLLSQNVFFQFLINSLFLLFFKAIRLYCKAFAYDEGRVVIVSLNKLGDTVFTIPAISEIRNKFGQDINILCWFDSVPIYELYFNGLNFLNLNRNEFYFGGRIAKKDARRKLKKLKPSLIIDMTSTMASASLIFNTRSKKIIGTNGYQFKAIYDQFVEFRTKPQLSDIYSDAISPVVQSSSRQKFIFRDKSLNLKGKILLHPFAGWKEKEWSLAKFIKLAKKLNEHYNTSLIIQKGQINQDVICEIENSNIDLIQTRSVDDLIECIKEASIFIGNDSGPVNIANFLGKPTFTVYGTSNPEYTSTDLQHQIYLQKMLRCSAQKVEKFCAIGLMTYRCSGMQCLNLISENEVYTRLSPMLKEYCQEK